ncbi:MAG: hypothetical protein ACTSWX_12295 [Promethearchaeota archaeon]
MSDSNIPFKIRCSFCGELNEFLKEELYDIKDGKEQFREKFCLECGEPLVLKCPVCNHNFLLNVNFDKNHFFKVLNSFWDPTPSPLDNLIPKIKKSLSNYEKLANMLTSDKFRLNREEFLSSIPEIEKKLEGLKEIFNQFGSYLKTQELEKNFKKTDKEIVSLSEEITSILKDIDEGKKNEIPYWINEKKEKKLLKHVPFLDFYKSFQLFINLINQIRDKEIELEQEALKPGFNKIQGYIMQDPEFYRAICPVCNVNIYNITHQIYIQNKKDNKLQFIRNIAKINENSTEISDTETIRFDVIVNIEKGIKYSFHGQLVLLLHEDTPYKIGRDLIREIDYQEAASQDILFDEDDPLARVSNSQLTLTKKNDQIILKGMDYDERRIGTFLNTIEHDIRIMDPDGVQIQPGSTIFIPLVKEINNFNQIKLILK